MVKAARTTVLGGNCSLVQTAKAGVLCDRDPDNINTIIYLTVGRLDFRFDNAK